MKTVIVWVITAFLLGLQYNFGLRRKVGLGSINPIIFGSLFLVMSVTNKTTEYIGVGLGLIVALVVVWVVGRANVKKHDKEELDKMKVKDIN